MFRVAIAVGLVVAVFSLCLCGCGKKANDPSGAEKSGMQPAQKQPPGVPGSPSK